MIELTYPWLLCAIALPLIIYWFAPKHKEHQDAVQVPYFQLLVNLSGKTPSKSSLQVKRNRLQRSLLAIGWICLVVALTKPIWVGEPIEHKKSARDILVMLDLSGSMSKRDFTDAQGKKIKRLLAAKQVLTTFAKQRENDRLGLILFGDQAFMQAPLTSDISTWLELLNGASLGIAGWQTAIGDAIGLSINVFENEQTDNRVLILLSDGNDTVSAMPPLKAAAIAKEHKIKVYTVAMGDPDADGEYRVDVDTLQQIASITGGQSFQAINRQELLAVYQQINKLEPQLYSSFSYRPKVSLHYLPFALYTLINLLLFLPTLLRRYQAETVQANTKTSGMETKA